MELVSTNKCKSSTESVIGWPSSCPNLRSTRPVYQKYTPVRLRFNTQSKTRPWSEASQSACDSKKRVTRAASNAYPPTLSQTVGTSLGQIRRLAIRNDAFEVARGSESLPGFTKSRTVLDELNERYDSENKISSALRFTSRNVRHVENLFDEAKCSTFNNTVEADQAQLSRKSLGAKPDVENFVDDQQSQPEHQNSNEDARDYLEPGSQSKGEF